jgi:hypothetical protein
MAMRIQWFAVALCTLLVLVACEESKVPPPVPSAPQGTSAGRSGAAAGTGGSAGKPGARPSTRPDDRDPDGRDDDTIDAGTIDDSDDGDAGSESVDAGTVDAGMVESWVGTTSQGLVIAFEVSEGGLAQIRIEYSSFGCDGDNSTNFSPPLPLGETFSVEFALAGATSVRFAGTFTDDDNASGTLTFMSTPSPGQPMCGFGVLSWTATRGAVPP